MERKEISSIAHEAADKVTISKRCLDKAYHVYEAHEYAHAASGSALKLDKESTDRYLNLMRHELEAADLPRENLEELGQYIVDAAHWIKEKNKEAVYPLGRFLDKTKELMFQVIVACECGEAKAIEKHLGEEALGKILATRYVTIADPGKTIFSRGNVVSEESFKKENDRVTKLGEAPATKEGSNPGVPYQEEGERIALQLGNGVIYNGPQMDQDKIYAHIFTDVAVTGTTFACLGFKECCARLIQVRKDFGADLPIFEGAK